MQSSIRHLTWIAPFIWIALAWLAPLHQDFTKQRLRESVEGIERFRETYHRLPLHLGEIRAFTRLTHSSYIPYDANGRRLRYIPLTDRDFLIQSFGQNEPENLLQTTRNPALSTLPKHSDNSVTAANLDQSMPQLYQPALLSGTEAPQSGLIASLMIHNEFQTRQLLVRQPHNADFYLLPFHDRVEEFLWLPSGQELVFTASGSQRYEDGVFFWDLKDNSVQNILPELKRQFWPQAADHQQFFIALSHISQLHRLLYILISPKFSNELDPKSFYALESMLAISIEDWHQLPIPIAKIPAQLKLSAFDYPLSQSRLIQLAEKASPSQQAWLKLKLEGDPENLIDQWQNFSSTQSSSPMFAYSLWWLASIYNDAFHFLQVEASPEALVLRNFGVEIADALHSLPTAPAYLQAMGLHLKKNLLLSKAADYNVSALSKPR